MHFRGHCDSEVDALARLSTPVKTTVLPRWQRKALEAHQGEDASDAPASVPTSGTRGVKTPLHGDRFVPNRTTMDMDAAHFNLTADEPATDDNDAATVPTSTLSPTSRQYRADVASQLFEGAGNSKILSFKTKAPLPRDGYQNSLRVLYSQNRGATGSAAGGPRKPSRHIPQAAQRVLDAPEMSDDFYLNLLDWSEQNVLAVGLGKSAYLWNATTGDIEQLLTTADNNSLASLSWARDGATLAVGLASGDVQLWDVEQKKRLRTLRATAADNRVAALAWNGHILSTGSRNGTILHHDVREAQTVVATLQHHTQEVCGLKWSPDGTQLASGANDNLLNIWGGVSASREAQVPLFSLTHHTAAVKALAWCPWQQNLLASGGGTGDRHLRLWNTATGACTAAVNTEAQVCQVAWSKEYRELVTSQGLPHNQLTIWRYPTLTKVAELTGHTARALHMAISPDGERVATAGGDETLRLWHCFASTPASAADGVAGTATGVTSSKMLGKSGRARELTSGVSLR